MPGHEEFSAIHLSALECDDAKHNLIIAAIAQAASNPAAHLRSWSFDRPGACAVQMPGRHILLGGLDEAQCRDLATDTRSLDYSGVAGPDLTAQWFVERATELGLHFHEPMPQCIHVLRAKPIYPGAAGEARLADVDDIDTVVDWAASFVREAIPTEPVPLREHIEQAVTDRRYMLWVTGGVPVSMAAIARRTATGAAISMVYTPPPLRGRGYAGSATAALAAHVFQQGKTMACLFTDRRNPYSNRCYARIGFQPVCDAALYPRVRAAA